MNSYRPLDPYISRDQTVYVDDDGMDYLLREVSAFIIVSGNDRD